MTGKTAPVAEQLEVLLLGTRFADEADDWQLERDNTEGLRIACRPSSRPSPRLVIGSRSTRSGDLPGSIRRARR